MDDQGLSSEDTVSVIVKPGKSFEIGKRYPVIKLEEIFVSFYRSAVTAPG